MARSSNKKKEAEQVSEQQFDETRFNAFLGLLEHLGTQIALDALAEFRKEEDAKQES